MSAALVQPLGMGPRATTSGAVGSGSGSCKYFNVVGRRVQRRATLCRAEPEKEEPSTSPLAFVDNMPYAVIGGLSLAGMAETSYLTYVKLLGSSPICPVSGSCESVLSSPYASLAGIPLSVFGFGAYALVALLSLSPRADDDAGSATMGNRHQGLVLASTLLASTSAWLMYTLFTKLGGQPCAWCFLSAGLSASITAATWTGLSGNERGSVTMPSIGICAATVIALSLSFANVPEVNATTGERKKIEIPYEMPIIATDSTPQSIDLARRLKAAGAKMYGAFWCSHCYDQKVAFGDAAMKNFPYVECYPTGYRSGEPFDAACAAADIQGFPTWIIGGEKYEGEQTFDQLEAALLKASRTAPKTTPKTEQTFEEMEQALVDMYQYDKL